MLTYLNTKKFVGDLSLQDADILAMYSTKYNKILEFGVGGSTQIMSQGMPSTFISVETDQEWVDLTKKRLAKIHNKTPVNFMSYTEFENTSFTENFNMIFVDGIDALRLDFALRSWKFLETGGVMIFHDTRRENDVRNVTQLINIFALEISSVDINVTASNGVSSNMTVVHKKSHEPYVCWPLVENKPEWSYGHPKYDDSFPLWFDN